MWGNGGMLPQEASRYHRGPMFLLKKHYVLNFLIPDGNRLLNRLCLIILFEHLEELTNKYSCQLVVDETFG